MSANEHPDEAALRFAKGAAEEEGYYFDGTNVWDCEDLLFHAGRVRDGAQMKSMIYAFRQGRTAGEKTGRVKLQCEIADVLGVSPVKTSEASE